MQQIKETLYGLSSNGSIQEWKVFVDEGTVVVEWGQIDGKKQTKKTVCEPKNVGRSNETTAFDQAISEAESKWQKKHDRNQYRKTVEELETTILPYPMLAQDGKKHSHKIKYPCDVQPKLDGIRGMVIRDHDSVRVMSRKGVELMIHDALKSELEHLMNEYPDYIYIDGELYNHELSLQEIVGACKNKDNTNHHNIEFHVFDGILKENQEDTWGNRKEITNKVNQHQYKFIEGVSYQTIENNEEILKALDKFIDLSYEGLIARNLDGIYKFGKRSYDLIKLKKFKDSEAKVIDVCEDKNQEGVLMCEWANDAGNTVNFECKMIGNHEYRSFDNMRTLVGEWVNFKYQAETKDGIPQFPVGQYVRDMDSDGNPVI